MTTEKQKPMLGLAGRYQFIKHKADANGNVIEGTDEVVLPWFDNLITNTGLNRMAVGGCISYCRLGTGSTTPTVADTNLTSHVGTHSSIPAQTSGIFSSGANYLWRKLTYRFNAGTVSGVNLAEVGLGWVTSGAGIFSHALLKDTGGSPTTISLASDEVLDVVYELRCYIDVASSASTFTIDGVSTTVTTGPYGWPNSWGWKHSALGLGSNPIFNLSVNPGDANYRLSEANITIPNSVLAWMDAWNTAAAQTYVAGSYSREYHLPLQLANYNFTTGIGSMLFGRGFDYDGGGVVPEGVGIWGFNFSPKIQKTASKTASIKIGLTWGRYTP